MLRSPRIYLTVMLIFHAFHVGAFENSSTTASSHPVSDFARYHFESTTISNNDSLQNGSRASTSGNEATSTRAVAGTSSSVVDPTTQWQYRVGVGLLKYGSPPLFALASVGNTMSIVVLQHPMFRKSSTSFILSALALVDLLYVDVGLTRQWIKFAFNIDIRTISSISCRFHVFVVFWLQWVIIHAFLRRIADFWNMSYRPITYARL